MDLIALKNFQERLLTVQNQLFRYGCLLTSNREAAKDLLQETTLKALENHEKFVDNTNFSGWMHTIMRNVFINNYRKSVRCQVIVDQTEELYHLNLSQESGLPTPEGSYTVKEIAKIIRAFPEEFRTPFSMHVAGYKYREIADEMQLPVGTIKSRIFFARKRLQELLKDYAEAY